VSSILDYRVGDLIVMNPPHSPVGVITKLVTLHEAEWAAEYSFCVWNCQIGSSNTGQETQFQPHRNNSIKLIAR
jgi:hypothetical protein